MENGIDRKFIAREVDQLDNTRLLTVSKMEARAFIDGENLPEEFFSALDEAQGESDVTRRYVVIYVSP